MLHELIQDAIEQQNKLGGIDVSKLRPPVRIEVETHNSTYMMDVLDSGQVRVIGGKYLLEAKDLIFVGSTWGGSMIRPDWIGFGMSMEFHNPTNSKICLVTSTVKNAKVMGPTWQYDMEWPTRI